MGQDMALRQQTGAPLCNVSTDDHYLNAYQNVFESAITLFRHAMGNYEVQLLIIQKIHSISNQHLMFYSTTILYVQCTRTR